MDFLMMARYIAIMFDAMKGMFFTFMVLTIILVAMSTLPQLQGMQLSTQLSHIANNALLYMQQIFSPLINFFYRFFG